MKPLNIFILTASPLLLFLECDTRAQSEGELPEAAEPWLAEEGDWAARYNQAQIACYQGSMKACNSIWLDDRVLSDTLCTTTDERAVAALISARSGIRASSVLSSSPVTNQLILTN